MDDTTYWIMSFEENYCIILYSLYYVKIVRFTLPGLLVAKHSLPGTHNRQNSQKLRNTFSTEKQNRWSSTTSYKVSFVITAIASKHINGV